MKRFLLLLALPVVLLVTGYCVNSRGSLSAAPSDRPRREQEAYRSYEEPQVPTHTLILMAF